MSDNEQAIYSHINKYAKSNDLKAAQILFSLAGYVAGFYLQACHDDAPPEMFQSVKRITFWEGLESLKYTLYDEEEDRLISFSEYEKNLNRMR